MVFTHILRRRLPDLSAAGSLLDSDGGHAAERSVRNDRCDFRPRGHRAKRIGLRRLELRTAAPQRDVFTSLAAAGAPLRIPALQTIAAFDWCPWCSGSPGHGRSSCTYSTRQPAAGAFESVASQSVCPNKSFVVGRAQRTAPRTPGHHRRPGSVGKPALRSQGTALGWPKFGLRDRVASILCSPSPFDSRHFSGRHSRVVCRLDGIFVLRTTSAFACDPSSRPRRHPIRRTSSCGAF
jgi:hypothetical protein